MSLLDELIRAGEKQNHEIAPLLDELKPKLAAQTYPVAGIVLAELMCLWLARYPAQMRDTSMKAWMLLLSALMEENDAEQPRARLQ